MTPGSSRGRRLMDSTAAPSAVPSADVTALKHALSAFHDLQALVRKARLREEALLDTELVARLKDDKVCAAFQLH